MGGPFLLTFVRVCIPPSRAKGRRMEEEEGEGEEGEGGQQGEGHGWCGSLSQLLSSVERNRIFQ